MEIRTVNFSEELSRNDWRVQKGTSFMEFYYMVFYLNKSWEVSRLMRSNKWYFDKMPDYIQAEFRMYFKHLKEKEERESEEYK